MLRDYLRFSINNLIHRRIRTWLTIVGIFIGIAAVVALVSLSQGMQGAIEDVFAGLGSDRVLITPKGMTGPPGTESTSAKLTEKDLEAVQRTKGVEQAAGALNRIIPATFEEQTKYPLVIGLPTDDGLDVFKSLDQYQTSEGRNLKEGDSFKAVVGYELTREEGGTFKEPVKIGKEIIVEGEEFEVVGVKKPVGTPALDSQIIISKESLEEITGIEDEYSIIHAISKSDITPTHLAEEITENLRDSRDLEEGNEDFQAQTSEQLMETVSVILGIVQAIIIGIAAISLLVGGIGIMNTMYTAVLERTNEIGVMKAIGAKNSDILTIFLIESGMLGLAGGAIGVVAGIVLSKLVEALAVALWGTPLISAHFSWWLVTGALLFAFLIGSASGTFPAIQASKMQPAQAVRYE